MPATVPACCGSKWRSRLIRGKARDMFVRSIKAIVYMISATGIMRIQRSEIRDGEIPALTSCCSAVVIEITRAVSRTHELRHPYYGDEGPQDSSGSVPATECPSLRGSLPESSPAKRNGRNPSVRKHPKFHRQPDKDAYAVRRNSCHQPCLLPAHWRSLYRCPS